MLKTKNLLFELGTEDLPPKVLQYLAKNLLENVLQSLNILKITYKKFRWFATPRRIGFFIENLATIQAKLTIKKEGPFINKRFDNLKDIPTREIIGFARACNVNITELKSSETAKGIRLICEFTSFGKTTVTYLPKIIDQSLQKLSTVKFMNWGSSEIQFVRPVHWVVLILGDTIVKCKILGCQTSNITYGHRFHSPEEIVLSSADNYFNILYRKGRIISDFAERKNRLISEAKSLALKKNAIVRFDNTLIEEITAIVEWPRALCCFFDPCFLRIPAEVLVLAIKNQQKSFPMMSSNNGKLINHFITISNIHSKKPDIVISGNNRVMSARLSDASFFYDTDIKISLQEYLPKLKKITFQKELGSMFDRAYRIALLSKYIAKEINADTSKSYRAGLLAKADLTTLMVCEFSELQGIIGKYYARAHYEDEVVCHSIEQQYWPKHANGELPECQVSQSVALAEKFDTLIGMFGILNFPSGDKDPLGLRRAAIGILRILKEKKCMLVLSKTINYGLSLYKKKLCFSLKNNLLKFFIDRLRVIYQKEFVSTNVFEAVFAVDFDNIVDFDSRIQAVLRFLKTPGAEQLCKNNKRITNILQTESTRLPSINPVLFKTPEEKRLYKILLITEEKIAITILNKEYFKTFNCLLVLDKVINNFFCHVMVMDKNTFLQQNRLALLNKLHYLFKQIVDIKKLSSLHFQRFKIADSNLKYL